jgi:hypothetical protein
MKSANYKIVQERTEGSMRGASVMVDDDIRLGRTTKASIKRRLEDYLERK